MRVLVAHSRYLSGDVSGENRCAEDEAALLEAEGHDVTRWITEPDTTKSSIQLGARAVWSVDAVRKLRDLIRPGRFDVMHVYNLFPQFSPAILRAARRAELPVVMSLNNFRLGCLPALLFRDGEVCESCVGKLPWRGVVHRCYRRSFAGSAALLASLSLHRGLRTFDAVARFIAVSEFVRSKHGEIGIPLDKIRVKHNFSHPLPRRVGAGDYFLFYGRLSPEKGLDDLLEAWKSDLGRLVIVGDGPGAAKLARLPAGVSFRGPLFGDALNDVVAGARAVIVPSRSYDACPRVIAEAYSAGVPVVGSDIGGISELVVPGSTGLLAPPGARDELTAALRVLLVDETSRRLGEGAHDFWQEHLSPSASIAGLLSVYEEVSRPAATSVRSV